MLGALRGKKLCHSSRKPFTAKGAKDIAKNAKKPIEVRDERKLLTLGHTV
jgi:hypothetical protein